MGNLRKIGLVIGLVAILGNWNCHLLLVNAENTEVDPSQPRSCYSCEGINCFRTTTANVNKTCTDGLDICVTIFNGFSVIVRGCMLDIADNLRSKCEGNSNNECHKCFGQLCNNLGRADFMCYECSGGDDCTSFSDSLTIVRCPAPTSPNSYCYVERKTDGSLVRGCSTNTAHQRSCFESQNCTLCLPEDSPACNNFNLVSFPIYSMASRLSISISILMMIFVKFLVM